MIFFMFCFGIFEIYSYLMYLLCHLKLLCSKLVLNVNMLDLAMIISIDIYPMWKAIQICFGSDF
jgi:hypothetical protein